MRQIKITPRTRISLPDVEDAIRQNVTLDFTRQNAITKMATEDVYNAQTSRLVTFPRILPPASRSTRTTVPGFASVPIGEMALHAVLVVRCSVLLGNTAALATWSLTGRASRAQIPSPKMLAMYREDSRTIQTTAVGDVMTGFGGTKTTRHAQDAQQVFVH